MTCRRLTLIFLFTSICYAQKEYVEIDNPVYPFLERLEAAHLINGYDEFEIPKTRSVIAGYLKQITPAKEELSAQDRQQFEDLLIEFDYDISDTTLNSESILDGGYNLFSDKSKYLYYKTGTEGSLFISLLAGAEMIGTYTDTSSKYTAAYLIHAGGQIRGTLLDKFGYSIKGTNGKGFGDESTALIKPELRYNLKFNENDEHFYDQTEGYFTADFDLVKFKIGRDRMNIGPGMLKPVLSSYSPPFDYIYLNLNYDLISFSYFHGKLLGTITGVPDSVAGSSVRITEKYMGYHRLGFDFSRHFTLGAGEMIIYGDRPIDFSYLNPFNFYKTVEHSNRDRDNSLLFFDFTNNTINGLKFYALILIDDIKFSEIGTGWWGNELMFNGGASAYNIVGLPLDIRLEYQRIEPYTFTHRLSRNSYTNQNYPLGSFADPNSEIYSSRFFYRFTGRFFGGIDFYYYVHGANPVNEDGSVRNVGGNINLGHRATDAKEVTFLDGDREYTRNASLFFNYEPVNQFIFSLRFNYISESLQNRLSQKKFESFFNLNIRI